MTNRIERRALLASAGAAIPGVAFAGGDPATVPGTGPSTSAPKQILEIPHDNAVFGVSSAAFEKYGYSPAVRAGGLLFIAGVVGVKPDGTVPESVAEQGELALLRTAEILRLQGLTMTDLVDIVSYHVDIGNTLHDFIPVKERHFQRPFPTWTIIGVEALARSPLKIEIRSIAAFRQ